MGNLLRLLSRDGDCCSLSAPADLYVDFESSMPDCAEDADLYLTAEAVLERAKEILKELQEYKGEEILEKWGKQLCCVKSLCRLRRFQRDPSSHQPSHRRDRITSMDCRTATGA